MDQLISMLTHASGIAILPFLFLTAAFLLTLAQRRPSGGGQGAGNGRPILVADRAVSHRALVQQSAAFLERPTSAVVSAILSRNRHYNILSAPYGPYWRAARRNMAAGVLQPSRVRLLHGTRARALGVLVRDLGSGAPVRESLHFAVFRVLAEICFGEGAVSELGEARLRAMEKLQQDTLRALTSSSFITPSWFRRRRRQALRRQQEELFLPLVAEVRGRRRVAGDVAAPAATYVESLIDLRVHGDGDRAVTDGELVSLISEFLGAGAESTAVALEWTMANLVKHPNLQQKLRLEVDAVGEGVIEEPDLSRMPYLKAVVLESLRRHPPVPSVERDLGGGGEEAAGVLGVPCGTGATTTAVNFLLGELGRDPAMWPDPMAFDPERFMPGGEGEGVDLTCTRELRMMPFGAGRRMCPGLATGMLHMEYFVANLVRAFEWRQADGDEVDLAEFQGFLFTTMRRPLRARLVPRGGKTAAT
ncbi:unnamed protein product [Urochloa decumbens]|uniref:Uncharacterized protein n=1 Tax=Urochloa decumbens TaxID=240449 RepID=A0ABC9CX14_9POAL